MPSDSEFKAEIEKWLIEFVEKPSEALNGWAPCPYARKARVKNSIHYSFVSPSEFEERIESAIENFTDDCEVVVVGTLPDRHDPDQIEKISNRFRERYWSHDFWVLFDHPEDLEIINGLQMNQGSYLLAMVQKLTKLAEASEHLDKEGYYETWEKSDKKMMLEDRSDKKEQLSESKKSITV